MGKAGAKFGAVLTMLNCVECGAVFEWMPKAKGRVAMYCSKQCVAKSHYKSKGLRRYRKTCEECGKEWETTARRSRFCSQRCVHAKGKVNRVRVCQGCGKQWEVRDTRYDTYCSRECAFKHKPPSNNRTNHSPNIRWRRVLRNISKALKKWRRCELCRRGYQKAGTSLRCSDCRRTDSMIAKKIYGPVCRICRVCQTWIGPRRSVCDLHQKKKDSRSDANRAARFRRRARKRGVNTDRGITLHRVAERDNDRCYLCMGLVDWLSHFTDDQYPSIDHVIPLVDGGGHTWDNVKLAHRLCNSIKGSRSGDGYLDYLPHLSDGYPDTLDPQPH